MMCPACGGEYVAGDRFCGNCGERLPEAGAAPPPAAVAQAPPPPVEAGAAACPVCGAGLGPQAVRCEVCGFEPGASVVMPGAQASASAAPPAIASSTRVCPIHGPLDPSWTRCPYCLREGREGRLMSGPIGASNTPQAAVEESPPAPPALPPMPPRMEPAEAVVPAAPAASTEPPAAPAPAPVPPPEPPAPVSAPPVPANAPPSDLPRSSVGATFAIRRRPRVLAYLIEREGEAVGRVHQLEEDVTDIGRDPRNHIVLMDVQVSGFHARVERGPDGSFLLQDRQSTNGTFVNDEQVAGPRRLEENDALRVGNTTLVLKTVSQ